MRKSFILTTIASVLILLPAIGLPQTPDTKRKLIAELIEVTGALTNIESDFRKGIEEQKRLMDSALPDDLFASDDLTEAERQERREKVTADRNRMFDLMIDRIEKEIDFKGFAEKSLYNIYDKHYTEQELKELISFYQTPIGKKVVAVSPLIQSETMNAFAGELLPTLMKIIKEVMDIELKERKEKLDNELDLDGEVFSGRPSNK